MLIFIFVVQINLFADATIDIYGNIHYSIDGKYSKNRVLKDGEKLLYISGKGDIKLYDKVANQKIKLSSKGDTYVAAKEIGVVASYIKAIFASTKKDNKEAFTRSQHNCVKINDKNTPLFMNKSTKKIEYFRDKKLISEYSVKNYKLSKSKIRIQPQKNDKIYLIDERGSSYLCYQINF